MHVCLTVDCILWFAFVCFSITPPPYSGLGGEVPCWFPKKHISSIGCFFCTLLCYVSISIFLTTRTVRPCSQSSFTQGYSPSGGQYRTEMDSSSEVVWVKSAQRTWGLGNTFGEQLYSRHPSGKMDPKGAVCTSCAQTCTQK